ncbi:MAG: insulinase family protein [Rhizobiales bacterium]|nr:insulinase family protein [Hyphomicrobiales bacterium]
MSRLMFGLRCIVIVAALQLTALTLPARAVDIQEVTSPGGIKAWLVQSPTIPLIAMNFAFKGGAALDPPGKEGLANFLTGMLDEGAGDIDSKTFQTMASDLAMKMSFSSDRDSFEGSFQTLSRNRDEAFRLLKLALTSPRFEEEPMERVRGQFLVSARLDLEEPEKMASRAWMKRTFGDHPYGRESDGTPESLARITTQDLRDLHARLFTRQGLLISVVGDIDAETLKTLLDDTFGALPDHPPPAQPAEALAAPGPSLEVIDRDMPQSIMVFGGPGIRRDDPDFIPAYIMAEILGGGGLGSRLTEEVREKRGLTYGVSLGLYPLDYAGLVLGSLGTRNEKAGEALEVVKSVMKRFAEEGPTQRELDEAKTYLTGSYPLRFDSNTKIARQLLAIQQDDLGIDYIKRRNAMIEAVTLDQVKAQAKRLIDPGKMIVTVVGRPKGLGAEHSAN